MGAYGTGGASGATGYYYRQSGGRFCFGGKEVCAGMVAIEVGGMLAKADNPAWGYGTHLIVVNYEVFALASDDVWLDEYVGQAVKVLGEPVEGYPPIGSGPIYLNVTEASPV
jgi:hypothetical protein